MKKLFLILLFVSKILNAQFLELMQTDGRKAKNWYVDKDANGNGDATNWTNASTSLSSLKWNKIKGGDTILVSGGADSSVYGKQIIYQKGTYKTAVTIKKSTDESHDGKVIFSNSDNNESYAFLMYETSNIKLENITFKSSAVRDTLVNTRVISIGDCNDIWVNNCNVISDGHANPFYSSGGERIKVTNSRIEVVSNNYPNDQDCVQIYYGGGHTITGNTLIMRGTSPIYHHMDIMQIGALDATGNLQNTIANNFLYFISPNAENANAGIYLTSNSEDARFLIYNNIITVNTNWIIPIWVGESTDDPTDTYTVKMYNNTFINGSNGTPPVVFVNAVDTLVMKNNLIIGDSTTSSLLSFNYAALSIADVDSLDIDYNIYYNSRTKTNIAETATSTNLTFAQWQALGHDLHGYNIYPLFANKYGQSISDYSLDYPIMGGGLDLSTIFNTDINGRSRTEWAFGAIDSIQNYNLSFNGSQSYYHSHPDLLDLDNGDTIIVSGAVYLSNNTTAPVIFNYTDESATRYIKLSMPTDIPSKYFAGGVRGSVGLKNCTFNDNRLTQNSVWYSFRSVINGTDSTFSHYTNDLLDTEITDFTTYHIEDISTKTNPKLIIGSGLTGKLGKLKFEIHSASGIDTIYYDWQGANDTEKLQDKGNLNYDLGL